MNVIAVCPLLVPQDAEGRIFDGILSISGEEFQLRVELPENKSMKDATLNCDWQLKNLLTGYEDIVKQRLENSSDLAGFMVEFKSIVESQLSSRKHISVDLQPPKFYHQLLTEIEEIGWNKLTFIDQSFRKLYFDSVDSSGRHHDLKIGLHNQHPEKSPDCIADLPVQHEFAWNREMQIGDLVKQFERFLEDHQEFWSSMDEIDKETWVLEPENPSRSATSRRIALGNSASLQMEVDPKHPRHLPECRFLGAEHVVNPLRENLNKNLDDWDPSTSLLKNLENVLETTFPSPENTKKEDFNVACGICYAYRLEEELPNQACDDPRCGQPFHHSCLLEWLRALPSYRQSFNIVFGECPYCSKPITMKIIAKSS